MRRVIAAAMLAPAFVACAPMPADAPTAPVETVAPIGVAPCEYEDGSGQARCVWDGGHAGNGVGLSYIVRNDRGREYVRYITGQRAYELVTAYEAGR